MTHSFSIELPSGVSLGDVTVQVCDDDGTVATTYTSSSLVALASSSVHYGIIFDTTDEFRGFVVAKASSVVFASAPISPEGGSGPGASASEVAAEILAYLAAQNQTLNTNQTPKSYRRLNKGDEYGAGKKPHVFGVFDGGSWPDDLSLYSWVMTLTKADLTTVDIPMSIITTTGSARSLRIDLAGEANVFSGEYPYKVVGTRSGDSNQKYTVHAGTALFE